MKRSDTPVRKRYDWDNLLDGNAWELYQGVDYVTNHIRHSLHTSARNLGAKIKTESIRDEAGTVIGIRIQRVSDA